MFILSAEMSQRFTSHFFSFYDQNSQMHIVQILTNTHTRKHTRRNLNTHLFKSISLWYAWLGTKPSSDDIKYGAS